MFAFSTIDIMPIAAVTLFIGTGVFMAKSKLSKMKTRIISVIFILFGLSFMFSYFFYFGPRYRNAYCISEITYYKGPNGNILLVQHNAIVVSKGSSETYSRLSVVDAETGKILHTVLAGLARGCDKELEVQLVNDDRVWYNSYKYGLHSRDPYTGKIIMTEKDIIKKYPGLGGSTKSQVTTEDGYVFESKPPGFKVTLVSFPFNKLNSGEIWHKRFEEEHPYTYNNKSPEDLQRFMYNLDSTYFPLQFKHEITILDENNGICFKNNDREDLDVMQLMHARKMGSYSYEADTCVNTELNLRNPFVIENYLLKNPRSILVGHYGFDEKRKVQYLMSRIDLNGNILWTLRQDQLGGEPNIYSLNAGILYLAIKGKLVAIDPFTGTKKWSTQL